MRADVAWSDVLAAVWFLEMYDMRKSVTKERYFTEIGCREEDVLCIQVIDREIVHQSDRVACRGNRLQRGHELQLGCLLSLF